MMGGRRGAFRYISQLVDVPVLGAALRLNVNGPMIRMMSVGHAVPTPIRRG